MISRLLLGGKGSGQLLILLFHRVPHHISPITPGELDAARFERTVRFVANHFTVLSLEEAVTRLTSAEPCGRLAAITLDDGYPDWLETVLPILERHGLPATFFVTTQQFDGVPLWHERIAHAVAAMPEGCYEADPACGLPEFEIRAGFEQRAWLNTQLQQLAKYQPLGQRERLIARLEAQATEGLEPVRLFTPDQLREIRRRGFSIGAHTVNHPILTRCTLEDAHREIADSKASLEAILNEPVTLFAFPNGRPGEDYGPEHVRLVQQCGYRYAVSTSWGAASALTDRLQLPRFTPWAAAPWRMAWQLADNMRVRPHVLSR